MSLSHGLIIFNLSLTTVVCLSLSVSLFVCLCVNLSVWVCLCILGEEEDNEGEQQSELVLQTEKRDKEWNYEINKILEFTVENCKSTVI